MKKLIFNLDTYNLERFLENYEKDFKNIFFSIENENLIDLIDFFTINNFNLSNKPKEGNIIDILKSSKLGLFLTIGAVADENVNYFRFLDGIQYRIADGEVYEHSAERFHDFKTSEKILNCGEIDFSVETALGLTVYIKEEKIYFQLGEIDEDSSFINTILNSGGLDNIINTYINKFKF